MQVRRAAAIHQCWYICSQLSYRLHVLAVVKRREM